MQLRVTKKDLVAEDVLSVALEPVGGGDLPHAPPGSHIAVTLVTPSGALVRRYSLCGDPNERARYEIAVLREPRSRGGSAFVHDALAVGDTLRAEGPFSEFPLTESATHSILIAGGIGITPLIPMLHRLIADGRSVEFHYAARSEARLAFRERLTELASDAVRFYSDDAGDSLSLDNVLSRPADGTHVYTCGPRSLIEAVRERATHFGWAARNVHDESFGAKRLDHDRPLRVELTLSRMVLDVDPSETILDAMLNAGVFTSYECKRGECGSCAVAYSGGRVDHRDVCLTPKQRESIVCTCVSWARSPMLILDA